MFRHHAARLLKGVTKQMDIHLKETIPKVFQPIHKAVQNEGIKEVVAKGGRGSGKSSYLSLELVLQLLQRKSRDCFLSAV